MMNDSLRPSDRAFGMIKEFEGFSSLPYPCPGGMWTNGWGHTRAVTKQTPPVSMSEAQANLEDDVAVAAAVVRDAVRVPLTQGMFDALVSFCFNVGPGARGIKSGFVTLKDGRPSTLLARINAGDTAGAATELLKWVYADGQRLTGLVRRRSAERALFLEEEAPAIAPPADPKPRPEPDVVVRSAPAGPWDRLKVLFVVLRKGRALGQSVTWKNRQGAGSILAAILTAMAPFLPFEVDHEVVIEIAAGIAALGWLLNAYLTYATSPKVGLPAGVEGDGAAR